MPGITQNFLALLGRPKNQSKHTHTKTCCTEALQTESEKSNYEHMDFEKKQKIILNLSLRSVGINLK